MSGAVVSGVRARAGAMIILTGGLMGSPVAWAAERPGLVAVHQAGNSIGFEPAMPAETWILTVSGPGDFEATREYRDEAPALSLGEDWLGELPDGSYEWRLVAVPAAPIPDAGGLDQGRDPRVDLGAARTDEIGGRAPAERIQTGQFTVAGGSLVQSELTEEADPERTGGGSTPVGGSIAAPSTGADVAIRPLDQVILDDLIVDGSACVGIDCVNGESFGFQTIKLKENNLRLYFEDTSTSASFPTRDWMLQANSSANGGASSFSIYDCGNTVNTASNCGGTEIFRVDAGAPTNSLRVDSAGNVGIGKDPVLELDVADGDTPSLRLDQDGSSGFTPQTWDVAGNETNFFVRDVTNGSRLPFRIRPSAPTSSLDIAGSGRVGLGTASPQAALHLQRSDGSAQVLVEDTASATTARTLLRLTNNGSPKVDFINTNNSTSWQLKLAGGGGGTDFAITLQGSGQDEFVIRSNGNVEVPTGTVVHGSSRDLKRDIHPVDGGEILERLAALPISTWRYDRQLEEALHIGPMAEDFYEVFGVGSTPKGVSPLDSSGVAFAAIQGLIERNGELEEKITILESDRARLESELSELRTLVEGLLRPVAIPGG